MLKFKKDKFFTISCWNVEDFLPEHCQRYVLTNWKILFKTIVERLSVKVTDRQYIFGKRVNNRLISTRAATHSG